MTIKNRIKQELAARIDAAQYDGFIELRMKKSNDVLSSGLTGLLMTLRPYIS